MFYLFYSSQESSEFIKLKLQDVWTCPGQLFTLNSQKEHFPYFISYTSWSSDTAWLFQEPSSSGYLFLWARR